MIAEADTGGRTPTGLPAKVLFGVLLIWSLFQLWYASPLPFIFRFGVLNDTEARGDPPRVIYLSDLHRLSSAEEFVAAPYPDSGLAFCPRRRVCCRLPLPLLRGVVRKSGRAHNIRSRGWRRRNDPSFGGHAACAGSAAHGRRDRVPRSTRSSALTCPMLSRTRVHRCARSCPISGCLPKACSGLPSASPRASCSCSSSSEPCWTRPERAVTSSAWRSRCSATCGEVPPRRRWSPRP